MEVSRIIQLAGRYEMVINQNCFIRIPELLKSHFFKFFSDKGDKNVMDHDPVHRNGSDITRLYLFARIMMNDLFNHCLAHIFLLPGQSRPFSFRMAFTSPPALKISMRFSGREAIGYCFPL